MSDHLSNFIDVVLAISFMEAILKPSVVRLTKFLLRELDEQIEIVPDFLHSKEE